MPVTDDSLEQLMKEIKKDPYIKKNKKDFDKIQKLYNECKNKKNCNLGNYDSDNKCVESKCPKENKLFKKKLSGYIKKENKFTQKVLGKNF